MKSRKELKYSGRQALKHHYWMFVVVCLLAAVLATEYSGSLHVIRSHALEEIQKGGIALSGTVSQPGGLSDVIYYVISDNLEEGNAVSQSLLDQYRGQDQSTALGRSRGILAMSLNGITSGSILVKLAEALNSIFHSAKATTIVLIILSFSVVLLLWMCIQNVFKVIARRIFLEGRIYKDIPAQRFVFLKEIDKWWRASVSMAIVTIRTYLWWLTVVGGCIKSFSYFLAPYIIAENPSVSAKEAIDLSRRMMYGHKWECFIFHLSFIGWMALGLVTLGFSEILYSNPYRSAALCEYYVMLRKKTIEEQIPGWELLNDRFLYERADSESLEAAYSDVPESEEEVKMELDKKIPVLRGFRKFCADVFGIAFFRDEAEMAFRAEQEELLRAERYHNVLEGLAYPTRLSPLWKEDPGWLEGMHYIRHYSLQSLIMLFFIFSLIGWLWEVSFHLMTYGEFVNRGTLHGPWVPIYGCGGVLILIALNKLRKKPVAEFFGIVVLCGVVEYFTSYILEITHDGMRWWDYTGYFLNLDGRICAEGLLLFGVGGMMGVYVLAPHLDSMIRKAKHELLMIVCLALIAVFTMDIGYSLIRPNAGEGITEHFAAIVYEDFQSAEFMTESNTLYLQVDLPETKNNLKQGV